MNALTIGTVTIVTWTQMVDRRVTVPLVTKVEIVKDVQQASTEILSSLDKNATGVRKIDPKLNKRISWINFIF